MDDSCRADRSFQRRNGSRPGAPGNQIENFVALGILCSAGLLVFWGLRSRLQGNLNANWLIAVGAVPAVVWFWMIVPPILGLMVLAGSLSELATEKPATT